MTTFNDIKSGLNFPFWQYRSTNYITAWGAGVTNCHDMRNNEDRHPEIFQFATVNILNAYNFKTDNWHQHNYTNLGVAGGTFGNGNVCEFSPSRGIRGVIKTGSTSTKIIIKSVTVPGSSNGLTANQLADRGDGRGYTIRIMGSYTASSGTTEEKLIVGNTVGTSGNANVVMYLDSALDFTPIDGDTFEIMSGSVAMMNGAATTSSTLMMYEIATRTAAAAASSTKPVAAGTDSQLLCLDELYVPYDRSPGQGFFGNLTATSMNTNTLTGCAVSGDWNVGAEEFRNFQVRIVEDTATPTAVGQRRLVVSHTAGPSPVYTLNSSWSVQPSDTATYVIEYPNMWIYTTQADTSVRFFREAVYCATDANIFKVGWNSKINDSTGTAFTRTAAGAGTMLIPTFGVEQDNDIPVADAANRVCRYSHVHSIRGGGSGLIDVIDIASAGGLITGVSPDYGATFIPTIGSCFTYDSASNSGRYAYINFNGGLQFYRYNVYTRRAEPFCSFKDAMGTAANCVRMACLPYVDGSTKESIIFCGTYNTIASLIPNWYSCMVTGY